jgi:hypothetical protein
MPGGGLPAMCGLSNQNVLKQALFDLAITLSFDLLSLLRVLKPLSPDPTRLTQMLVADRDRNIPLVRDG